MRTRPRRILRTLIAAAAVGGLVLGPVDVAAADGPASLAAVGGAAVDPAEIDGGGASVTQTWALVPASADGPDGRGRFDYTIEPGDRYEDFVAVRNLGEEPLTVDVYAQDASQTVDSDFELLPPDETSTRIGAWLSFAQDSVTIEPRSFAVIPFALDVPADVEPGDHAAGLVAVSALDTSTPGAAVQYRVGTRMHVRIAGPVEPSMRIDRIRGGYAPTWSPFGSSDLSVDATLVNDGNIRLTPRATVTITGVLGLWADSVAVEDVAELLPGGATTVAAALEGVPQIGPLWVTVGVDRLTSRDQDVSELVAVPDATVVVWAVPWVALTAIALLVVAALIAIRNLRLRRRVAAAVAMDEAFSAAS